MNAAALDAGVARVNISPDFAVRLSGYGNRTNSSQGVAQQIWAKAIALGSGAEAALVVTVDNCGLSAAITDQVSTRLQKRFGITRERIAFCCTHTHSAPMVSGVLPNLFSADIRPDEQAAIERYTRELIDKLEQVGAAALADRRAAHVSWVEGTVTFAMNRRAVRGNVVQFGNNAAGPVDHSFPLLVVTDLDGKVRALWGSYACHCTTLGGDFNQVHGDWAGCAQAALEREYPGAIALVSLGCGGDANPNPRGKMEIAEAHGREVALEVKRLLALPRTELATAPQCKLSRFNLDFDPLPSREEWDKRSQQKGIVGYHARKNIARLDRGEALPTTLPYMVQTWAFGTNLAMVFLAGEVVVDYELRLKRDFDRARMWVNGYANDVPCYIPSARVLREGGYEAQDSLWYYDRPARLSTNNEDRIITAVHSIMPAAFNAGQRLSEMTQPLNASEALHSIRVAPELAVDLVAAEPLVVDPVAIDWGADGKLWVVEMRDYPMGIDGHWKPGGRVKFLQDTNADGHYDTATVFMDGLPFPTGVFAWRKGVLICAAPDIIYAEDTDGDGRADVVRKIFSGFETNNYQARVNSLSLGLDGWVYGANGLLGGVIRGLSGTNEVNIRGRDFRMNPDTGAFEPASGLSQQGRVRDDFGNWFGCDNSHLVWHFPLPDKYVRRNPFVSGPNPAVHTARGPDWNRLYPSSRTLERFNEPKSANRVTSACGLEIYRDMLLGQEYYGNAFTCEPVHNLVHREVLSPDGVTFTSARADTESSSEFFSSTDNWCRPVQARTGPDGALWIVDMYRFVIEHPRWIPPARLAQLDIRGGEDKGRIYRVYRKDSAPRPLRWFSNMVTASLVAALDSPNGTERDMIHRELLQRADASAGEPLAKLAANASRPAVRVQALSLLAGLHRLERRHVLAALRDADAQVRATAVRLAEDAFGIDEQLLSLWRNERVMEQSRPGENFSASRTGNSVFHSPDSLLVRYQVALSAGGASSHVAASILRPLLTEAATNVWLRAAVLCSATNCASELLAAALEIDTLADPMLRTLVATADGAQMRAALRTVLPEHGEAMTPLRLRAVATLVEAVPARGRATDSAPSDVGDYEAVLAYARETLHSDGTNLGTRDPALRLLAAVGTDGDIDFIGALLKGNRLQSNALAVLSQSRNAKVPELVIAAWPDFSPLRREMALEALAARAEWRAALIDAVEQGKIGANEVPISLRNRLRTTTDENLRARVTQLWPERRSDKAQLLARYEEVVNGAGDKANGRQVFERICANCHSLRGVGHVVGPDLAPLHDKSAQDFLVAILDPNAAVEPRFINYNVETKDGRSLSGVIRSETATGFTLVQGGGIETPLLRSEVAEIHASALSLMPEGLEQGITPVEMNDLIAFVKQPAPRRFGSASLADAAAARERFQGQLWGGTTKLIGASERLDYASWLGRLPLWHCRQTDGTGRVEWESAAQLQRRPAQGQGPGHQTAVEKGAGEEDRFAYFIVPAAMGLASQPQGQFILRVNHQQTVAFDVALTDAVWSSADGAIRLSYEAEEANAEDSNGPLTISVRKRLLGGKSTAHFEVIGSAAGSQRWFGIYDLAATRTDQTRR